MELEEAVTSPPPPPPILLKGAGLGARGNYSNVSSTGPSFRTPVANVTISAGLLRTKPIIERLFSNGTVETSLLLCFFASLYQDLLIEFVLSTSPFLFVAARNVVGRYQISFFESSDS